MHRSVQLSLARFQTKVYMSKIWFSIGHFVQATFNLVLVPLGWAPVVVFMLVLAFGAIYWMNAQAKYTRRAKERNEYI